MHIALVVLVIASFATSARAEFEFIVDPTQIPAGVDLMQVSASAYLTDIQLQNPHTIVCNSILPGPQSPNIRFIIAADDIYSIAMIHVLRLSFPCAGEMVTYTRTFNPYTQFYLLGPANPPAAVTDFQIDTQQFCAGPRTGTWLTDSLDAGGAFPDGWVEEGARVSSWQAIQEDGTDWALRCQHLGAEGPGSRLLLSPIFDLSWARQVAVGFTHQYAHDQSTAEFLMSVDGGSNWQTLDSWSVSVNDYPLYDIRTLADGQDSVRFGFRFEAFAGSATASWELDDLILNAVSAPPVADQPVPVQPPEISPLNQATIGCRFRYQVPIQGNLIQYRVDWDVDGTYTGPDEDWTGMASVPDSTEVQILRELIQVPNGLVHFEFRAKVPGGEWGYSGDLQQEGIEDDWTLWIQGDTTPPEYSDFLPVNQPDPAWVENRTQTVGVRITDDGSILSSTLAMRVDQDGNGLFEGAEDWTPLNGYSSGHQIDVTEELVFDRDGEFRVQFRAADLLGNSSESPELLLRADTQAPPVSVLHATARMADSLAVEFTSCPDLTFLAYELQISTDSEFDAADLVWSTPEDPALAFATTATTIVTGLVPAQEYWARLRAVDALGHAGQWSNTVSPTMNTNPPAAISDLRATLAPGGIQLDWSAPIADSEGLVPVWIDSYSVYGGTDPNFTPGEATLLGNTPTPGFLLSGAGDDPGIGFFRVTVDGIGLGTLPEGLLAVPEGEFTMGPDPFGHGAATVVTLSDIIWMDETEVTNADYVEALQWAWDNGLVQADS
ncbi:MAG: hypothetical protein KDC10_14985, partial [Calditrichaeota bacterium]|nr:hypothetical protein [Calditrichota bacterium]